MKKMLTLCVIASLLPGCDTADDANENTVAYPNLIAAPTMAPTIPFFNKPLVNLLDLPYGADVQQRLDFYPATQITSAPSKVFIVLHGGGWSSGDKSAMASEVAFLRLTFPTHAVVNLNYRLADSQRLGYPMQITDIDQAINFLDEHAQAFHIANQYAMIGISAGGHLAMLYSYKFDTDHEVKAVCSIVGPADFSDPKFRQYPLYQNGVNYLIGYNDYLENPTLYDEISPAKQVTAQSPKTLLLYGDADPVVANTQGPIMKQKLTEAHVYNELYQYPGAGHANWNTDQQNHVNLMQYAFFKKTF